MHKASYISYRKQEVVLPKDEGLKDFPRNAIDLLRQMAFLYRSVTFILKHNRKNEIVFVSLHKSNRNSKLKYERYG